MKFGTHTVIFFLAALLSGCYVTRQGIHQFELLNSKRPVAEVEKDTSTPEKTRKSLEQVGRILKYAEEQGLNTKGAYHDVILTEKPVVSYIVQAAEPDRLEFVTWWFPIVGSVPYLGYFEESERDEKAASLAAEGYDIRKTGAGAFSSLGWFDDPIFSSMLERNEADMAHLFFHELTHRTLWVPGSTEFNENLAEYCGMVLAVKYLKDTDNTAAIERYQQKRHDRELFRDWLLALKSALEKVYANDAKLPRAEILKKKQATFDAYLHPPLKPAFKVADYIAGDTWNNATVLGEGLYAPDVERFRKAHNCVKDSTIHGFLEALRKATEDMPDDGDAFAALDGLCKGQKAGK